MSNDSGKPRQPRLAEERRRIDEARAARHTPQPPKLRLIKR